MNVDSDSSFVQSHMAPAAKNYAKFYPKWVRNNFLSKKEGKEVGEYRDFVMIICPGQPKSEVHREVQDKDKRDYSQEWTDYKAGKEHRVSGTPIELLPGLDQGRIDSLKAIYIYSIEQLAEASEPAKQKISMGATDLVQRAQNYLQKNTAEVAQLRAENAELRKQFEALQAQVAALLATKPVVAAPRKPGRPRKVEPSPVPPQ